MSKDEIETAVEEAQAPACIGTTEAADGQTEGGAAEAVALRELATEPLAVQVARLARDAKGEQIEVLRVFELVQYTDYFIIVSGRSDRHVRAIREHIQDALKQESGRHPQSVEGVEQAQWVLMDYGELVVHIFYEPVREYYELGRLWDEAPRVSWDDEA